MRKWLLGAMCATFVVAASHDAGAFKDGNALLEYAESENEILNFLFIMYVAGVAAGARDVTIRWKVLGKLENREPDLSPPFCVPENYPQGFSGYRPRMAAQPPQTPGYSERVVDHRSSCRTFPLQIVTIGCRHDSEARTQTEAQGPASGGPAGAGDGAAQAEQLPAA